MPVTGDQLLKRMQSRQQLDRGEVEARIAEVRRELFSPFAAAAGLEQRERMLLARFAKRYLEMLEKAGERKEASSLGA